MRRAGGAMKTETCVSGLKPYTRNRIFMNRLEGKRALITGGTTGIGLAAAKQFLAEGARLVVTGFNDDTLAQARRELGGEVAVLKVDAGDVRSQKQLAQEVAGTLGQLDVAFINAGIGVFKPLEQWDEASYDRSMAVNLKGPFFLVQALLPVLAHPASVILTASVNAHVGMANSSVYSATKAGLISLARTLSGELIERGIRVNTLSPGPVNTPIYGKLGMPPEELQKMADAILTQVPAQRFGSAEEVALAAVYLASDESRFAVGSELVLDGGFSAI
jgi:NAD(P)-dependent dehydrogenase (short-subunit alcohol dehydrogenase family)